MLSLLHSLVQLSNCGIFRFCDMSYTEWPWGYLVLQCTCWEIQGRLKRCPRLNSFKKFLRNKAFLIGGPSSIQRGFFLHQNLFFKAFRYISRLTRFPSSVTGWRNQFHLNLKTQQQNITDCLYFNSWSWLFWFCWNNGEARLRGN